MTPRKVVVVLVLALVAVAVVPVIMRVSGEKGPAVGQVFEVSTQNTEHRTGRVVRVELPIGTLVLRVGAPIVESDYYVGPEFDSAPEIETGDRRYLPVAWELDFASVRQLPRWSEQFEVDLVAGDERIDLEAGNAPEASAVSDDLPIVPAKALYAVVPDEGVGLTIEVLYDGHAQSVDLDSGEVEAGVAGLLYEPDVLVPPCAPVAERWAVEVSIGPDCWLGVSVTPYDPELGWAETADDAYVRVDTGLRHYVFAMIGFGPRAGDYTYGEVGIDVTVDGAAPDVVEEPDPALEVAAGGVSVFRVGAGPHKVSVTTTLPIEPAPGTAGRALDVGRTQVFTVG